MRRQTLDNLPASRERMTKGDNKEMGGPAHMSTKDGWLIGKLRRVTSTGRFVPEIDGLRFLAIISVVAYHLNGTYLIRLQEMGHAVNAGLVGAVAGRGNWGVQLFFAISGFILSLPFAQARSGRSPAVSLKSYYIRRLSRLEPPYVVNMLFMFVLAMALHRNRGVNLVPHLGASLVYLHNLIFAGTSKVNVMAWTLEIEAQFYLLAPLLTWVFAIRRTYLRRGIILAVMIVAGLAQIAGSMNPRVALSLLSQIQYFLAGFLLTDVYLWDWEGEPSRAYSWDLFGFVALALLVYVAGDSPAFGNTVVFPLLTFVLYVAGFRGHLLNWFFRRPAITVIGGMCYTIYLYHYPVLAIVNRVTLRLRLGPGYALNYIVQLSLCGAAVLVCAAILFVLIERPCMKRNWYMRFLPRSQRLDAPPVQDRAVSADS